MFDALDALGRASGEVLWVPLLAWSALWLGAEAADRLGARVHPLVRYRATQAVLLALPLGLALAPFLDPSRIAPWLNPPVVIDAAPLALALAAPEAAGVLAPPLAPTLTGWGALGLVVLALAALAGLRLTQVARQAWTLRLLRRALPASDPALAPEAYAIAHRAGVRRKVRVVATPAAPVPMTFGLWRPVVVLPEGLEGEARSLALLHELVHVRRRDALAAGLEALTAALFSFHPGVRRLARRCGLLRELACDAALLSRHEVRRGPYAALVARFAAPAPRFAAVGMSSSPSHVHQRITAMTRPLPLLKRSTLALGWSLAVVLLVVASLAVTTSRALAQEARVIVRTVEGPPPVIVVDGVRQDDSVDALATDDVHSAEVLSGEDAQSRFGENHVVEVITKTEAAARGLPQREEPTRLFLRTPGSEGAAFRFLQNASGDEIRLDTILTGMVRLQRELTPGMLELHGELEPGMLRLAERMGPVLLEFKNGLEEDDSPLRRLYEQIETNDGTLLEVIDAQASGADRANRVRFAIRDRAGRSETGRLQIGPVVDLESMKGLLADTIESLTIRRDGADRLVTITGKDGTVREVRLSGPISTPARGSDLAPEAKTTAEAPLAPVASPNPASRAVTVRYAMGGAGTARLRVYDLTGRKVYEREVPRGETVQTHRVDVSALAPGGYVYRLEAEGAATQSGRFTVAR